MSDTQTTQTLREIQADQQEAGAVAVKIFCQLLESSAVIPWHLHGPIANFLGRRRPPISSFLRAALENDLITAVKEGDPVERSALVPLIEWLRHHAPARAWGNPENVAAWLEGREANEAQ